MADKRERLLSPVGECKWCHVHSPKPAYVEPGSGKAKGEPKYQVDVVFDPTDPEWRKWAADLTAQIKALPVQTDKRTGQQLQKQQPLKRELDEADQPTGRWYVTFKTGAKFRPGVFDRKGSPVPESVLIGNGSKVRVNYTPAEYEGFGGGVALYLNAVQVVELVEYQPQTADRYGFPVEAGTNGADDPFGEEFPDAPPPDDDLPF
jgi:hypothetical protein